jgi:hypothetical protein
MNTSTNAVCSARAEAPDVAVDFAPPAECGAVAHTQVCFAIPPQDEDFFASHITHDVQRDIRRLLGLCRLIHASRDRNGVQDECRRLAAIHLKRGFSASALRTKYYKYIKTGDWRVLWDKAKAPLPSDYKLPGAFLQFVIALMENNQRKFAPAHTELIHIWRTHSDFNGKRYDTIPGYQQWPDCDPYGSSPRGWSYANLSRQIARHASRFTTVSARIGRSAARQHALKVYSSREHVACGEYILFDDHEFDLKINFPKQRRAMRPRGFCAMDLLSACCISKSFKPTLWDEAEEKKRGLTEKDFMWFVVDLLTRIGHRTDERGTAFVVEWGTAAIRDQFEQRIHDATRGLVRIERSGKFGAPAHIGQAEGRTHGNFRFKALIESFFNPLNNFLGSLPGQVGKDRNHSPEQLHGLERENDKLLQIAERLGEEHGLQFPFLTWREFLDRALYIIDLLNKRTGHKLQGWEKLGFIAKEWRLASTPETLWLPASNMEQLPPEERRVAVALIQSNPALTRSRRLSPQEVWEARQSELRPLPLFKLPELLGPDLARELSVHAGVFEFEDQELDSDPLRFMAVDPRKGRLDGKFTCYINPFNLSHLVACDSHNRVMGICARIIPPSRNDIEGIKRQMGNARAWEASALAELNARHIDGARASVARRAHNAGVIERAARIQSTKSAEPVESIDLRPEPAPSVGMTGSDDSTPETYDLR